MMRRLLALVVLLLLAGGCSAPLPVPEPDPIPAALPPALSAEQADGIISEVMVSLAAADSQSLSDLLTARLTGPAAAARATQYALRAGGDPAAVTVIPSGVQTLVLPATDTWPRTVMAITDAPADLQAPLLLTLVQNGPREPYRLWAWVRLFPGVQSPPTAQPEVGSAPVGADSTDLAVAPAQVLAEYVDVLTNVDASPYAASFVADPLRTGIQQTRDAFVGLVGANGSLTETHAVVDTPYTLATADGGAIVVGAVQTVTTITLNDSTLTIADETAALLGATTVKTGLVVTWLSVVAFAVPPAGSTDPIEVIGAEHSRIQVTGS